MKPQPKKQAIIFGTALAGLSILVLPVVQLATSPTRLLAAGPGTETVAPTATVLPVSPDGEIGYAPAIEDDYDFTQELIHTNRQLSLQIHTTEAQMTIQENTFAERREELDTLLAEREQSLQEMKAELAGLTAQEDELQQKLATEDAFFQAEMDQKIAQLAAEEAQLRAQIEDTYAQLQAAYDQLAGQQPALTGSGGGGGGSSSGSHNGNDDSHDDEHEDDHEDHEDHEREDHDDD